MLPKPENEEYKLVFSNKETGFIEFELDMYNKNADVENVTKKIFVAKDSPVKYSLTYDPNQETDFSQLKKDVSFQSLRDDINNLYQSGNIKTKWARNILVKTINIAEKQYTKNPRGTKFLLHIFQIHLKSLNKHYIDSQGFNYLKNEAVLLRSSLAAK